VAWTSHFPSEPWNWARSLHNTGATGRKHVRRARGSPSHLFSHASTPSPLLSAHPLSHHGDVAVVAHIAVEDWLGIVTIAFELNAAHRAVRPWERSSDLGSERCWVLASQPLVLSPLGAHSCKERV
jgi:hypothetical protein